MAVEYGRERRVDLADRFGISLQAVSVLVREGERMVENDKGLKETLLK